MMFFIGWIAFAALVGVLGKQSTMGGWAIFGLSLILSPVIGLIICLLTQKSQQQIAEELAAIKENTAPEKRYTSADEKITLLDKARSLLKDGVITEAQFNEMRDEIVSRKEHGTFEERCPIDPDKEETIEVEPPKDDNVMKPVIFFVIFLLALALYAYYITSTSTI